MAPPSAEIEVLFGNVVSEGTSEGSFRSKPAGLRVEDRISFVTISAGAGRLRVDVSTSTEASLSESTVLSVSCSSYAHIVRNFLGFT